MIKFIVTKFFPLFILNAIRYFIKGNIRYFEQLAEMDDKPRAYVDGYVTQFGAIETKCFFEKIFILLKAQIHSSAENCSVLDVGCGTGRYLSEIRTVFPYAQLYGIDASENTVKNYTDKVKGIKCVCSDLSTNINPFGDVTFDFVYSVTVIEYVPFYKVNGFIGRICAFIKPGGRLLLQFPQSKEGIFWLISNLGYTRYPPSYICKVLINNRFKIIESASLDGSNAKSEKLYGHYVLAQKV